MHTDTEDLLPTFLYFIGVYYYQSKYSYDWQTNISILQVTTNYYQKANMYFHSSTINMNSKSTFQYYKLL